jgi:ELWxxDGT repeat protein
VPNGRLYFIARHDDPAEPAATKALGSELWASDGTEEGTYPVPGFAAAPAASIANQPIAVGNNQLTVLADDGVHGMNPWRVDLPAEPPVPAIANRRTFYNSSSLDGRDPAATQADLNAVAPDKAALRPGRAASVANMTSYAKGINGVVIDFAGELPDTLTADDFAFALAVSRLPGLATSWPPAPPPAQVVALPSPTGAAGTLPRGPTARSETPGCA